MWYSRLTVYPNPEIAMPWNRTTQQLHKRPDDHSQNDLTDAEWTVVEPMLPK